MPTAALHPSPDKLQAFAQGRLPLPAMAEIEQHVAACDSCCAQLQAVPDDTLVHLAREAATRGFREEPAERPSPHAIPPELLDHPRYRVLGLVGVGGMGAVYKAEHRLMERLVALKVVSPAFLSNAAAVERFRREFRAVARLSHPNVVTAFDADQAGELHFLVMEFVEGLSLDRLVAQRGALPVAQACRLIRQAAQGLAHVHEKGLVHRDIKPPNLMVGRGGHVKILDCGLARLAGDRVAEPAAGQSAATDSRATAAGMILGTPDYIAPEQCQDARTADIRSDIYSLGCTLYFALAGQPPFPKGSVVEKLTAHASLPPKPIRSLRPEVPAGLARVLERMLAKDPAERYQSPADVAADLAPFETAAASTSGESPPHAPTLPLPPVRLDVAPTAAAIPESDPLASLNLGSIGSLPPVSRTGKSPGFKFGPAQLTAVLLACGAALAIMILATAFADQLFPDKAAAAKRGSSPGEQPLVQPAVAPAPPAAVAQLPKRVLFVIPNDGLWLADYRDVRSALEASGVAVEVASTSLDRCRLAVNSEVADVYADVLLDQNLTHERYGAVVFTGMNTKAYLDRGSHAPQVQRLLSEFQAAGKPITAICGGELVLAAHGQLDGHRAARHRHGDIAALAPNSKANWIDDRVVRDGQIITAGSFEDAAEFASEVTQALEE